MARETVLSTLKCSFRTHRIVRLSLEWSAHTASLTLLGGKRHSVIR